MNLSSSIVIFPLSIRRLSSKKHSVIRRYSLITYLKKTIKDDWKSEQPPQNGMRNIFTGVKIVSKRILKGLFLSLLNVCFPCLNRHNSVSLKTSLVDYCPKCGCTTSFCDNSTLVPVSQETGEWICPQCKSRREWNREKAKQQAGELFTAWFLSIDCFQKNKLYLKIIALYAQKKAYGLNWLFTIEFFKYFQDRIGHLVGNTAVRLLDKKSGAVPDSLEFYGYDLNGKIANNYLLDKWISFFNNSSPLIDFMDDVKIINSDNFDRDIYNSIGKIKDKPLIFSAQENDLASQELAKMGISDASKIVTLVCRDDKYLRDLYPESESGYYSHRNANIDTYRLACEYLVSLGYYVLRMGANQERRIDWSNSHIIDYSYDYRTDFMDVWLLANCAMCITTSTGPDAIAVTQGKNVVFTNFCPPLYCISWGKNIITLFKDIVEMKSMRVLPLAEVMQSETGKIQSGIEFHARGYSWRDNTPDELLEVVKEAVELLVGTYHLTTEESKKNEELWNYVKNNSVRPANLRFEMFANGLHPNELSYHGYFAKKYLRKQVSES